MERVEENGDKRVKCEGEKGKKMKERPRKEDGK